MRTIGFRLGLLIFGCLLIAVAACGGIVYALHITDRTIDRALDAQRRLDLLTEMSGRIQQYGLIAISSVAKPEQQATNLKETEAAVYKSIKAFEPEIAKAINQADLPVEVNAMAARAKPLEQVRAGFRILVQQVDASFKNNDPQARGDMIRGAFNGFATLTGPYLFFLMQADRRGVEAGREEARTTSNMLERAAFIFVVVATVGGFVMYRLLSRPILAAVAEIRDAAIAIGQGKRDVRLPVRRRDELGLLAVVFNRMTARLRRGEQRVAADRLALETTVADRTADLRSANEKLSEIDRSRRRFFADVSHELRTPLTVILGECEIALATLPAEDDTTIGRTRDAFAVIRRRGERLRRRIEDMLRVARSESGTIELHFKPIALQAVCASAIEAFEGATKRKDVDIRLNASPDEIRIDGDFEWLRQIVEGMIDNALRYATNATMVVLDCQRDADHALLRVSDDGPGFGVDDPNRLMVRFARRGDGERGTIENMSGHGIGLSLVRWVVDKHHGHVTLHSAAAPLHGAEILISLPLASA